MAFQRQSAHKEHLMPEGVTQLLEDVAWLSPQNCIRRAHLGGQEVRQEGQKVEVVLSYKFEISLGLHEIPAQT